MPLPSPTAGTNKAEEEAAGVPPVPECSWGKHEQKHGLQTATDPGPPAASSNAGANRLQRAELGPGLPQLPRGMPVGPQLALPEGRWSEPATEQLMAGGVECTHVAGGTPGTQRPVLKRLA